MKKNSTPSDAKAEEGLEKASLSASNCRVLRASVCLSLDVLILILWLVLILIISMIVILVLQYSIMADV